MECVEAGRVVLIGMLKVSESASSVTSCDKMKLCLLMLLVVISTALSVAECPPYEYNPGQNCGLEPSCPTRIPHKYPKYTCDCWCIPGTYRRLDTNECVPLSGCKLT